MSTQSVAHLKYRLGLLTSSFGACHPLKACPKCIELDRETFGWTYWHRAHQFPGVWACPHHGELLLTSRYKVNGVGRFLWFLPSRAGLQLPIDDGKPPSRLCRLSQLICSLTFHSFQDGELAPHLLRRTLQDRLVHRGYAAPGGRVHITVAAKEYLASCGELSEVSQFPGLPQTMEQSMSHLRQLMRADRGPLHPLRWFLAFAWLFDDFTELLTAWNEPTPARGALAAESLQQPRHEKYESDSEILVLELLEKGRSARSAAAAVGVDVTTVLRLAARSGLRIKPRPKVLREPVRSEAIELLMKGMPVADVAGRVCVSVTCVRRLLYLHPMLYERWKVAANENARHLRRTGWLSLIQRLGSANLARHARPAHYAWLYRNDRAWLASQRSERPLTPAK